MEYTIEELDGKLNRLISILCHEQNIDINKFHLQDCSLGDKRMIFRGLSNRCNAYIDNTPFLRAQSIFLRLSACFPPPPTFRAKSTTLSSSCSPLP